MNSRNPPKQAHLAGFDTLKTKRFDANTKPTIRHNASRYKSRRPKFTSYLGAYGKLLHVQGGQS